MTKTILGPSLTVRGIRLVYRLQTVHCSRNTRLYFRKNVKSASELVNMRYPGKLTAYFKWPASPRRFTFGQTHSTRIIQSQTKTCIFSPWLSRATVVACTLKRRRTPPWKQGRMSKIHNNEEQVRNKKVQLFSPNSLLSFNLPLTIPAALFVCSVLTHAPVLNSCNNLILPHIPEFFAFLLTVKYDQLL